MCALPHDTLASQEMLQYKTLSKRQERSLVFHLLYAAEEHSYQTSLESIADNLTRGFAIEIPFDSYAFVVAEKVIGLRNKLDERITPFLHNWRFERVGLCTKLILRYAMYELFYTSVASNIVINEAVELAKCFSEKDAYKFVNGVLDEATKEQPKAEEHAS